MEETILRFTELLRRGGVRVSLSEAEDALHGLAHFGISDGAAAYTLLKATLLKNEEQKDIFDLCWRICFFREEVFTTTVPEGACSGHDGEKGTSGMNEKARHFYGLLRDKRGGDAAKAIDEAFRKNDLPDLTAEELAEQLKISLGWFMASYALKQNGDDDGLVLLNDLDRYLKCRAERTVRTAKGEAGIAETLTAANRTEKDFSALSAEQVKQMEREIARLGKKLAGRYSYRLKPAKKGIPDMRRVMADTALRGHLPVKMPRLDKKKDRPELVVLCDISGSMGIYSSFCLQLVCAMEKRFERVRSFLFIENIIEADFDLENNTIAEAVEHAMEQAYPKRTGRSKEQCTTTGVSDYGRALEAFRRKFADVLTPKTTVVIMGDAKTNWFPPKPEELRDIRSQCAKVIWLNPEPKEKWDTEDSMVRHYLPHCDVMAECRNLKQLEQAMRNV
ncbi:MAG: VWA domain-containing protein [Firmicutes bacterium]|nr:VWA domain-containing protein [Bacillota bacterium]MBQ6810302.1 VWA domain-containing protein [Bacillota bacterium]